MSSHDPQDVDTKRLPFADAEAGAIGLETLLAAALRLHHGGDVTVSRIIDVLSTQPAAIFGLSAGTLRPGATADVVVIDPEYPWIVREEDLRSLSKNSSFEGARFQGRALQTIVAGETVFTL